MIYIYIYIYTHYIYDLQMYSSKRFLVFRRNRIPSFRDRNTREVRVSSTCWGDNCRGARPVKKQGDLCITKDGIHQENVFLLQQEWWFFMGFNQ